MAGPGLGLQVPAWGLTSVGCGHSTMGYETLKFPIRTLIRVDYYGTLKV